MTQLHSKSINEILAEIQSYETDLLLVIVDEEVWDIYKNQIPFESELKNKEVFLFKAVSGEKAKSFFEFEAGIEFFLEKKSS